MAKTLSQQDIEYLESLSNKNTNDSMALYGAMKRLKRLDEDAFAHCGHLVCSYLCPANVAFLAFDLTCRQLEAGRNANPQKIFQPLSKNNRSSYEAVKPLYDDALALLARLAAKKEEEENNREEIPAEIISPVVTTQSGPSVVNNETEIDADEDCEDDDDEYDEYEEEDDEEEQEYVPVLNKRVVYKPTAEDADFAEKFLYENYFKSNDSDRYVVNTCPIPKSAWLINVYATTYEDYCKIVQDTVQELNDAGTTLFLTKPEVFKKNNKEPRIAYSVLTGEKFNFASLSDNFVKALDECEEMNITNGVKIANRATIQFASFIGACYNDGVGGFSDSDKGYLSSFAKEEEILATIEEVGIANNIVKHYIEIRTGIPQSGNTQIYKTILCRKEDIMQISSFLRNIKGGELDFIISSDKDDIEILFIHISHLDDLIDKIGKSGIPIDLNPNFDEMRI